MHTKIDVYVGVHLYGKQNVQLPSSTHRKVDLLVLAREICVSRIVSSLFLAHSSGGGCWMEDLNLLARVRWHLVPFPVLWVQFTSY